MCVTVIVPTYNVSHLLKRCVDSIGGAQTAVTDVLIVDDGSTDGTLDVAYELSRNNDTVSVIRLTANSGPGAARNEGLQRARGKYVAFVDADDYCRPGRIDHLFSVAKRTHADVVSDDCYLINDGDATAWSTVFREYGVGGSFPRAVDLAEFLGSAWVLHPLVRLDFLRRHQLEFRRHVRYGEDLLFYVDMLLCGARWYITSEPLYYHVARSGSITRSDAVPLELLTELRMLIQRMEELERSHVEVALAKERLRRVEYVVYKKNLAAMMKGGALVDVAGTLLGAGTYWKYIPGNIATAIRRKLLHRRVRNGLSHRLGVPE